MNDYLDWTVHNKELTPTDTLEQQRRQRAKLTARDISEAFETSQKLRHYYMLCRRLAAVQRTNSSSTDWEQERRMILFPKWLHDYT